MLEPKTLTDKESETNSNDKLKAILNFGAEIAGGAVSAAAGLLIAGPAGAILGGASGPAATNALKKIGQEASDRLLSPRETVRVGGALAIAASHIKARSDRGDILRSDGFFERAHSGRTDAEEVVESVLLKSQREAEERKIPFLAYLFANVAFDPEISGQLAHQMIKAAETMTYRQLCILKMIGLKGNYALRSGDYRGQTHFAKSLYQVLYECVDLYHRGFVNFGGEVAFGPTDVKPSSMGLQGIGADLFTQMGLATIPEADVSVVAAQLR